MQLSNAAIKTLSVVGSFCLHAAGTAWLMSTPHRPLARPKQAWNVTRLAFLPPKGIAPDAPSHGRSSPTKVVDGTNRLGEDIDIDSVRIEILADDKKQMGGVLAKYGDGEALALEDGEPLLDLIHPGAVDGREVHAEAGMPREPGAGELALLDWIDPSGLLVI